MFPHFAGKTKKITKSVFGQNLQKKWKRCKKWPAKVAREARPFVNEAIFCIFSKFSAKTDLVNLCTAEGSNSVRAQMHDTNKQSLYQPTVTIFMRTVHAVALHTTYEHGSIRRQRSPLNWKAVFFSPSAVQLERSYGANYLKISAQIVAT